MPKLDPKPADAEVLSRAVARAKEQDVDALRFLYVRFADDVCRYVQTIVGDRRAAEDLTQTLFSQLLDKVRHHEPREAPFKGWLLQVAHDAAVAHLRTLSAIPFEEGGARNTRFNRQPPSRGRSAVEMARAG